MEKKSEQRPLGGFYPGNMTPTNAKKLKSAIPTLPIEEEILQMKFRVENKSDHYRRINSTKLGATKIHQFHRHQSVAFIPVSAGHSFNKFHCGQAGCHALWKPPHIDCLPSGVEEDEKGIKSVQPSSHNSVKITALHQIKIPPTWPPIIITYKFFSMRQFSC